MFQVELHGIKVFDNHVHFPLWKGSSQRTEDYIGQYGQDKFDLLMEQRRQSGLEMRKAHCFPKPEAHTMTDEELVQKWEVEMDTYNMEGISVLTGGGNDRLARMIKGNPRFFGWAHHDPFEQGAAEELERCIREYGFRGYKILAPALTGKIEDQSLYPIWEVAEKYEIPVLIHFGTLGGGGGIGYWENLNPLALGQVTKAFPKIPFIIPHFGNGFVRELLMLAWESPNVYVDTSGSNRWVRWMPYELDLKQLFRKFLETVGPERIIFGTDSSWFPRGFAVNYLLEQIRILRFLNLRDEDLERIFYKNALTLVKP